MTTVVYYDLETTGLPKRYRDDDIGCYVIEIGAQSSDRAQSFQSLVNPGGDKVIEPAAQKVHNISKEMVAEAETIGVVLTRFVAWLKEKVGTMEIVLVAHNNWGFDMRVLRSECKRVDFSLPASIRFADTMIAVERLWPVEKGESRNLLLWAKRYVPDAKLNSLTAHRAAADVELLLLLCEHVPDPKLLLRLLIQHAV
jgi:DNA polymerase-3 subunit epsilon